MCAGPLGGTAWDSSSLSLNLHCLQPEGIGTSLPGIGTLGWEWVWDSSLLRGDFHKQDIAPDFYLLHMGVRPALSIPLPLLSVSMWLL